MLLNTYFLLVQVTVIDANSPSEHLESFHVCSSHLLCVASVPGAKETDYEVNEELNRRTVEESEQRDKERRDRELEKQKLKEQEIMMGVRPDEVPGGGGVGSITFVHSSEGDGQVVETGEEAEEVDVEGRTDFTSCLSQIIVH